MANLNVNNKGVDDDLLVGEVATATDLEPATEYVAELKDGDTILSSKKFTTEAEELPDPDPEVKPNKIPAGSLVIHPSATSIMIEDTDKSQSRKNQHLYVRMNSGKYGMVSLNKDAHLSDRSIEVTGTMDADGNWINFTPETKYDAKTFIVGYIQDASTSLEADGLPTDEFTTTSL